MGLSQWLGRSCAAFRRVLASSARALARLVLLPALAVTTSAAANEPLPLPGFDLTTNGSVGLLAQLSDGSVIVGGYFTSIDGVPRSNLAKLRPDGSLDPDWDPAPDQSITAIAVDGEDNVYVAGNFGTIGGLARNHLAKLSPTGEGAADATWNPATDQAARELVPDGQGNVYVGGNFTLAGPVSRLYLAKLAGPAGTLDASWNPAPNGAVTGLALDASGALYVGGSFSTIGGQNRARIAKLATSGAGAADASWNPGADGQVSRFVLDGDAVYALGSFFTIGGKSRNFVAKLAAGGTGAVDAGWNPNSNGYVYTLVPDGQGAVYIGGWFTSVGGISRSNLVKVSASTGAVDPDWDAPADEAVDAILMNADGTIRVAGGFANVGGRQRLGLAVVDALGETTGDHVDVELPGYADAIVSQPDGSLILGGDFWKAGDIARPNILRLRPDHTLDPDWNPAANGYVGAIALDADGSVYVGGNFTHIGGRDRLNIARVAGTGTGDADAVWNPSSDDVVSTLAVIPGQAVFAGGSFFHIGGLARQNLAKLSPSGTGAADATWNPFPSYSLGFSSIGALALDGAGSIYAAGHFTSIGGATRGGIAKLATGGSGAADPTWNPAANGDVSALALDGSGSVYAGGTFTTIGGRSRTYLAKLSASGTGAAVASWNPSLNEFVYALALDAHGGLFVGGPFVTVNGVSRTGLARLSTTDASLDANWNASVAGQWVSALARVEGEDVVAVSGDFTAIAGVPRVGLALMPTTARVATTMNLTLPPSASVVTEPVTATAFVFAGDGTQPTGQVEISDGTTSCTAPLVAGIASCTLQFPHVGNHELVASFAGDDTYAPSASPVRDHFVVPARTAVTIRSHTPEPSVPGQTVTVTVDATVLAPGVGVPTGTIVVSSALSQVQCTIDTSGGSCDIPFGVRGPQQLEADFVASDDFDASVTVVTHRVNEAPLAFDDSYETLEDTPLTADAAHGLLANDQDPDGDPLTVVTVGAQAAGGIGGTVMLAEDGSFTYTPPPDGNGTATFAYLITDGLETAWGHAVFSVGAVNDPPVFTLAVSPSFPAGTSGVQTTPAFTTVLSWGPGEDDAPLAWHVRVVSDPAGVLSGAVTISLDGTLTTPLSGHGGVATLAVALQDDGGTANGGNDTSAERAFTVAVGDGTDLSVSIEDDTTFVAGGDAIAYRITARNAGPENASGARVRAMLSANLVDAVWTCAADAGASCAAGGSGEIDDLANIPSGAAVVYTLTATTLATPELAAEVDATVTAPSGLVDLDPLNDSASDVDTVGVFADGFDTPERQREAESARRAGAQ